MARHGRVGSLSLTRREGVRKLASSGCTYLSEQKGIIVHMVRLEPLLGAEENPFATLVSPVLTGFTLAAVVILGTTTTPSRPHTGAAAAVFVGSSVAFVFSMQMIALGRATRSLGRSTAATEIAQSLLFEVGLLLLLVGLGLALWPREWGVASATGVAAAWLGAVADVVLSVTTIVRLSRRTPSSD
jgi:hypothetical protein